MNPKLLSKIQEMNQREIYEAVYTDQLTRVLNRRAFDENVGSNPYVTTAIVDLDSLKYLNSETPEGYRTGDKFLVCLANTLVRFCGPDSVYRIAGDEFAVTGENYEALRNKLELARNIFPGFSFGIGSNLVEADTGPNGLRNEKHLREQLGLRAGRGECPPWMGLS